MPFEQVEMKAVSVYWLGSTPLACMSQRNCFACATSPSFAQHAISEVYACWPSTYPRERSAS